MTSPSTLKNKNHKRISLFKRLFLMMHKKGLKNFISYIKFFKLFQESSVERFDRLNDFRFIKDFLYLNGI